MNRWTDEPIRSWGSCILVSEEDRLSVEGGMKGNQQRFVCEKCGKVFFAWRPDTAPGVKVKCYFCKHEQEDDASRRQPPAPPPPAPVAVPPAPPASSPAPAASSPAPAASSPAAASPAAQ